MNSPNFGQGGRGLKRNRRALPAITTGWRVNIWRKNGLRRPFRWCKRRPGREPTIFWAWFVRGDCHAGLGEDVRAEACYATCITLAPDSHWAYFNRGLAFLREKDYAQACADFDEVLRPRPAVTEAWI